MTDLYTGKMTVKEAKSIFHTRTVPTKEILDSTFNELKDFYIISCYDLIDPYNPERNSVFLNNPDYCTLILENPINLGTFAFQRFSKVCQAYHLLINDDGWQEDNIQMDNCFRFRLGKIIKKTSLISFLLFLLSPYLPSVTIGTFSSRELVAGIVAAIWGLGWLACAVLFPKDKLLIIPRHVKWWYEGKKCFLGAVIRPVLGLLYGCFSFLFFPAQPYRDKERIYYNSQEYSEKKRSAVQKRFLRTVAELNRFYPETKHKLNLSSIFKRYISDNYEYRNSKDTYKARILGDRPIWKKEYDSLVSEYNLYTEKENSLKRKHKIEDFLDWGDPYDPLDISWADRFDEKQRERQEQFDELHSKQEESWLRYFFAESRLELETGILFVEEHPGIFKRTASEPESRKEQEKHQKRQAIQTTVCPVCHKTYTPGQDGSCPFCRGKSLPFHIKYCIYCGEKVRDANAAFCSKCGKRLYKPSNLGQNPT